MSTYGRNFAFLISPRSGQRAGRYSVPTTGSAIPIGAPIKVNNAVAATSLDLRPVQLATGAQAVLPGECGILVYEYGPNAFAGDDPDLVTYSDKDTAPLGAAVQMVSGTEVKVLFRNTNASTFLQVTSYAERTMVSEGVDTTTPNVDVGDYLTPGAGTDDNGYWTKATSSATAWLVITKVDDVRSEVEARMLF
jgi:hypothetical protein